jgi:hypothetical protein
VSWEAIAGIGRGRLCDSRPLSARVRGRVVLQSSLVGSRIQDRPGARIFSQSGRLCDPVAGTLLLDWVDIRFVVCPRCLPRKVDWVMRDRPRPRWLRSPGGGFSHPPAIAPSGKGSCRSNTRRPAQPSVRKKTGVIHNFFHGHLYDQSAYINQCFGVIHISTGLTIILIAVGYRYGR